MKTFSHFLCELNSTEATERIDPKTFDLRRLYSDLNHQCFDGKLDDHPIRWGATGKGVTGRAQCKVTRRRGWPESMSKTVPGSIHITIAPAPYTLSMLKGIVAHEMCHVWNYQFDEHERNVHGARFLAIRAKANAKAQDFEIPLTHKEDAVLKAQKTALPVCFTAGVRLGGQTAVRLYTPKLRPAERETVVSFMHRFAGGYKWIVFGEGTTILANDYPLSRKYSMGAYAMPLEDITPTKIHVVVGDPPAPFR